MDDTVADFAILIPHYNQSEELDEAIASCADAQLSNRAHLVVVDDGSSAEHDIGAMMARWSESGKFRKVTLVKNQTNCGVAASLNNGLRVINAPYFFRIDSDDRALQNRFAVQMEQLQKGRDLVFSEARIIFGGECIARTFSPPARTIQNAIHFKCLLMHPTLAARTEFFKARGGYPENTRTEDWDFWKSHLAEARFVVVDEPLTSLGLNLNSVSNAKFQRAPNFEKLFKLKTALRYADRKSALKAAKEAGLAYYLAVYLFPNPYRIRLWLQLMALSIRSLMDRLPFRRISNL